MSNQSSGSADASVVQNKKFTVPTALPQQMNAREHRANSKDQRAEEQRQVTLEQFRREAQTQGVNGANRACNAALQQSAHQRLEQVHAKDEMYAQVPQPKATQPSVPLALAPSSQRMEVVNARADTMTRRAMNQVDAQVQLDKVMNRSNGTNIASALLREAAQRNNQPGVCTLQAEKERYERDYRCGNEEAYAHVDALQKSIRGYTDTSAPALEQVKQWNQREAARRGVSAMPRKTNNFYEE